MVGWLGAVGGIIGGIIGGVIGGIMGAPIAGPGIPGPTGGPNADTGGGGEGAIPIPGTDSPRTATGPYFATTSPNLP